MTTKTGKVNEEIIGNNQMVQTQDWYCAKCGRFLAKQAIVLGVVWLRCPNCKEPNTIEIIPET